MRNLKKFLALVLAMMMACSLVVTGSAAKWNSGAGTFDDQSGVTKQFEEGVAVVTGMEIFKGDAGTKDFRPAANIKRSEVAAIVYRLATGDVTDSSAYLYTHVAPFTDVNPDDWFAGYVGYLWNAEIIKGSNTERTQFNPYGEVTGYEALAMVLRAMGYDENDEFTGAGWQIRVGQYANKTGLLDNVNATNYGAGHLNAAARRDTVAEIIFQAATKPTVTYTPAFGYHTTEVTNGTNVDDTSLGKANFGLTWDRGIVVGNQSTGESATKMTFVSGQEDSPRARIDTVSYIYGGVYDDASTDNVIDPGEMRSETRSFSHVTGLNDFGHAQKVWYNYAGGVKKTYAWFDEATKSAVVSAQYVVADSDLILDGSALAKAAKAAGFTISTDDTSGNVLAFASNKYDRMGPLAMDDDYEFGTNYKYVNDIKVALEEKQDEVESPIKMYKLVSNSGSNLDVIISLDAEVAQIYDTNTTNTSERIVLREATLGGDNIRNTTTGKGEILTGKLTPGSVKSLGTNVEAWVVDGTTKKDLATGDPDRDINSWYETIAVKQGPTGTVSTVDSEGTVTLSTGETVRKSYLYDVVMGGCITQGTLSAGVNYTFVLDSFGRYLGTTSDSGFKFIYGTFADHSYGGVGSGELKYLVYGVDTNGGKIIDQPLTSMELGSASDPAVFDAMSGAVFNTIEVARRDYGTTEVGNQVARGVYRGGVITADGKWWVNDESDPVDYGYTTMDKSSFWQITSTDAARGFLDLNGDGTELLTNNTVFYVVSGTGTASLNVKVYNGMTAFLDGATVATIDADYKDFADDTESYDVVYMTNRDTYHSVGLRDEQNAMVTKVFMCEDAVERNSFATMFYAHDDTPTGLQIAGHEGEYAQYELWQGTTKANYFLAVDDVPSIDTFYNMTKIDTVNGIDVYALVAVKPILKGSYALDDNGAVCWENQHIDYFATNETSTARIGDSGKETVYGVKDATVFDLTKQSTFHSAGGCLADGAHDAHNEIKSVADLFYAISVGYDVKVSIVNSGSNVNLIYVVHVDDSTIYGS